MKRQRQPTGRGKKIGTLTVVLDRERNRGGVIVSRANRARFQVDLRFDTHTGDFHAQHDGQWYSAKTKADIEAQIKSAVDRTVDVEWERYLIVRYRAEVSTLDADKRPIRYGSKEIWDIDHDRADLVGKPGTRYMHDRTVTSIELDWTVKEYTKPFELPEKRGTFVRMVREVTSRREDDEVYETTGFPEELDNDELPAGAVLWTEEREEFLRSVLVAFGQLDAKLVELFRGTPDEVAGKIAAAGVVRLLNNGEK